MTAESTRLLALEALQAKHAAAEELLESNRHSLSWAQQLQAQAQQLIEAQLQQLGDLDDAIAELEAQAPANDEPAAL